MWSVYKLTVELVCHFFEIACHAALPVFNTQRTHTILYSLFPAFLEGEEAGY